jgi:hypothetical protein
MAIAASAWYLSRAPRPADAGVVTTIRSGEFDVVLLADEGVLRQGRSEFSIEFRQAGTGILVDVGDVTGSATMTMPGMVMPGNLVLQRGSEGGRYRATAEFGMAGAWQMRIDWNGPVGKGSIHFEGNVQ